MAERKLGRNDPCWCGSGKKLKKCHGAEQRSPDGPIGLRVRPRVTPKPITTHSVRKGGRWIEEPGLLEMVLHTMRPEDVDAELQALRREWGTKLQGLRAEPNVSQRLASRLGDIQHKLQGVRYHSANYLKHEEQRERDIITNYRPPAGATVVQDEPTLIFELEGFLYQVKSTLDMLPQLLRDVGFRSVGDSFGDHGERLLRQLEQCPARVKARAESLAKLITIAQERWIDQTISLRDQIAHKGMLSDLGSFTEYPYVGGTATVKYPTMPTGERVRTYVQQVEKDLRAFVDRFVLVALDCVGTTQPEDRDIPAAVKSLK